MNARLYYLTEAAKQVGVSPITLKRWLLDGKVYDVRRDRKGWRVFTDIDISRIKQYAERLTPPPHQETLFKYYDAPAQNNKSANFRDSAFNGNKSLPFHRWVPWIAGFSANFVEDCFKNYLDPSIPHSEMIILDPFAGVGTTLTEGVMHGYNVVGFEINPYAYLACRVKLNGHNLDVKQVRKELDRFLKYYQKRVDDPEYSARSEEPKGFGTRVPFYSPKVERKVLIFFDFLPNINNLEIRDLFKLAFGAVMVGFSNYSYEPSLGRKASSGRPDVLDAEVQEIIADKIKTMISDIEEFDELHAETVKKPNIRIFNETFFNAMNFCENSSIDLVVTSPPYLNNYHYLRNTRPQMHWLQLRSSDEECKAIEHSSFGKFWQTVRDEQQIDPIFKLERLDRKLETLRQINPEKRTYGGAGWANYAATYFNDSYRFCEVLTKILKSGGKAIVVIGNSILQGVEIKTDEIFAEIGEMTGLRRNEIILLRTKRTGSSIVDSTVRSEMTTKKTVLYETAVVLERI
jgi:DNA modification methylase